MTRKVSLFHSLALAGAVATAAFGQTATAAPREKARLVSCGAADCLLLSGVRADAGQEVQVNGHSVPVEGGRGWKVLLPVETVRAWSRPGARSIAVGITPSKAEEGALHQVVLPIGMLGSITELAYLVIPQR
ncbi:hypothetical protein [Novosphingobium sp. ZW T3_23]|uniref:hypothetical protein n=1 Tax=Novosphingobium sp. ZW T3_23 TaxID=3378084 RepID=UPI00385441F4